MHSYDIFKKRMKSNLSIDKWLFNTLCYFRNYRSHYAETMSSDTSSAYSGSDTMHSLQSGQEYTITHLLYHVEVKQHWEKLIFGWVTAQLKEEDFLVFFTTYISDLIFVWWMAIYYLFKFEKSCCVLGVGGVFNLKLINHLIRVWFVYLYNMKSLKPAYKTGFFGQYFSTK